MPELPEVETVRMGLAPVLEGRRLVRVQTRRANLRIPFPNNFAGRLEGRRVVALTRRAKYLLARLDSDETLVMHLGMSGRFTVLEKQGKHTPGHIAHEAAEGGGGTGPHDHVVFETDKGARIVYTDARRFGLMTLAETASLPEHRLFRGLGPEPLDSSFNATRLGATIKGRRTSIKAALLDQGVVAGIGNIYACEALFRAHISPKKLAGRLTGAQTKELVPAIKSVLRAAIQAGGSSLRDYHKADGELGTFQHHFLVYGREGKPCPSKACSGTIQRITQGGRSTFYCPSCQK
jgi:formamidopyrimidine-DNA glycosylase